MNDVEIEHEDEYGEWYIHEALHAAYMVMSMWDVHISESRCADEFEDVKKAANKVFDAMAEVYQLIGNKFPGIH